jgi:predicted dienelactone hydrolase
VSVFRELLRSIGRTKSLPDDLKNKKGRPVKTGLRTGLLLDASRRAWTGDGPRPVHWTVWYPAAEDAVVTDAATREFIIGAIARDADINNTSLSYPVVLLSHGTGGTAISLSWLAKRLTETGYIVIGPDHHGNTAMESYHPAGFAAWWERAQDLTFALDTLSANSFLAGRMDTNDVTAIGFSLGGYTAMSLLGAITDFELFKEWAHSAGMRTGPAEFPDLPDRMAGLRAEPSFQQSWARQSRSYKDARARRAILLAPAPPIRAFTSKSLTATTEPVVIMVGGADREAPADICAEWLHAKLPNSTLHNLGADVGHLTFMGLGTEQGRVRAPELYVDRPGVDRARIHDAVVDIVLTALKSKG